MHNDLGNVLNHGGRFQEAEETYRRAIDLKPDFVEAYNNLGTVLRELGRLEEAEQSCRKALELRSDIAEIHNNLAVVLWTQLRLADAESSFRRALVLNPRLADAHSNLIFMRDLRDGYSEKELQDERRAWYAIHGAGHAANRSPHLNTVDPERRLRIGYVSADFREHSAFFVIAPVILQHNRSSFEVICYSGAAREDALTRQLQQAADGWRSTLGVPDEILAERIRKDRVDILVDLSGHSAGNRLLVFCRKPAPVQVSAWGHANGTGVSTIDYLLLDRVSAPPERRHYYAEQIIDLPNVVCYQPPAILPPVSPLPASQGKVFTFGCVNRCEKISDRVIGLWSRILDAVPHAGLLVKDARLDSMDLKKRLNDKFRAVGVDVERVLLIGHTPHFEHLETYNEVDVGLDPFPHNGGVSTLEALTMGVPIVTLAGRTMPSCLSASMLSAMDMREWIARNDDEYVRIAVDAAGNHARLAAVRRTLRQRLVQSPIGDTASYTREVERFY
ncbi:MAG: tetratricopeptide repeat protein, partial [Betaproteobacteria bacterium]|nr:tetratricopeptide repeat protein [Betaproteobacteria bacterium]